MTLPQTTPLMPIRSVNAMLMMTLATAMTTAVMTRKRITCAPLRNIDRAVPTAARVVQTPTARINANDGWTDEVPTQTEMIGIPKTTRTVELDPATATDSRSDRPNVRRAHPISPRLSASRYAGQSGASARLTRTAGIRNSLETTAYSATAEGPSMAAMMMLFDVNATAAASWSTRNSRPTRSNVRAIAHRTSWRRGRSHGARDRRATPFTRVATTGAPAMARTSHERPSCSWIAANTSTSAAMLPAATKTEFTYPCWSPSRTCG